MILMHIPLILLSFASEAICRPDAQLTAIFRADTGLELENIAVRRNGNLLLTAVGSNSLLEIDPRQPAYSTTVATILDVTSLTGITEISRDVFAVVAGNYTRQIPPQLGSFSLRAVDESTYPASTSKIANIPTGGFLNGATAFPSSDERGKGNATILINDTIIGSIFHVDPSTGRVTALFQVQDLANSTSPPPFTQPGVIGLRYIPETKTLYYTNTIQAVFGSVKLQIKEHMETLPLISVLSSRIIAAGIAGDDFLVRADGISTPMGRSRRYFHWAGRGGIEPDIAWRGVV
ncbi:hypothetical protein KVT40_008711 [Elsinoe batatas]|uniref:Uncharacterized protein n=1 Tax=Elsinoe batatas TaxID=2601811 RepID=A0A8K0KUX0_9PEZI|nr:hypothetical protein KVT40_008711 [Elsinoe batatas]